MTADTCEVCAWLVYGRHEETVQVFEYQWPLNDRSAEWFVLQEHMSEFLGVVSFKRKYPGIRKYTQYISS